MRWIRRILGAIVLLVVALVGIAYLLPREVSVARSTTIDAPPEAVFGHINSLQAGAEWSPWLGIDLEVQLAYSGPEEGVGNALAWISEHPKVGSGAQEIVESVANEKVVTDLDFGDMAPQRPRSCLPLRARGPRSHGDLLRTWV